ncbi:MAG: hypothetical protein L6R39_004642 [Caloplaca ligustica]|nr:MAG: hypothetical protein L6R39_004642 [Caloplaca ligustica]
MAPLLHILISLLPSLPGTSSPQVLSKSPANQVNFHEPKHQLQQTIGLDDTSPGSGHTKLLTEYDVSAISWGVDRLDVFSLVGKNVTHKYWDGHQWKPEGLEMETLGKGLGLPPVAVTWGVDRLDIFGLDDNNVIKHQYWDGTAWQPNVAEFESLGVGCHPYSAISATTWGPGRLDIFCSGDDGEVLHQYYDGSQWQPSAGSMESLNGSSYGGISVVSWGKDSLDIFALNSRGILQHLFWNGSQWGDWDTLNNRYLTFEPNGVTATSWGENRLDVFGRAGDQKLWHRYFNGTEWSYWERLDDDSGNSDHGSAAVTSWSPNRLDLVLRRSINQTYWYKYYDGIGQSWRPDTEGWYDKSPDIVFLSNPSMVSWGENRLDIFGITFEGGLLHQAWTGSSWYPGSTEWELLAGEPVEEIGRTTVFGDPRLEVTELRK